MQYKYRCCVHFTDQATKAWEGWLACAWSRQLVTGRERIHLQVCFTHSLISPLRSSNVICIKHTSKVVGAVTQTDSFCLTGSLCWRPTLWRPPQWHPLEEPSLEVPSGRASPSLETLSTFCLSLSSGPFSVSGVSHECVHAVGQTDLSANPHFVTHLPCACG